jgi:hypothetical protein
LAIPMMADWYSAQPLEDVKACNLCGGHRFDPHAQKDRYGLPVISVRCHACGLIFLNPRMTPEAYRDFYRNGTYRGLLSEFYGRPINAETIEAEQQAYATKLTSLLMQFRRIHGMKTLLDIGGSTGVVADCVSNHFNLEPTVLEPSEAEAKRAIKRGLRVYNTTIDQWDTAESRDRYDLVLLCQTIDHLMDIRMALRKIRAMLTDDGLLFVDVVEGSPIKVDHPYYLDDKTAPEYFRRVGLKVLSEARDPDGVHINYMLRCG